MVDFPPEVISRTLARLVADGGLILPDALYRIAEAARLCGCSPRHLKRLLERPGPLRDGLHEPHQKRDKQLVKGSAILRYHASIKVTS